MVKFDLVAKIVLSPLPESFTQEQGQILLPSSGVDLPSRPARYFYKVVSGLPQPLHHRKVACLSLGFLSHMYSGRIKALICGKIYYIDS